MSASNALSERRINKDYVIAPADRVPMKQKIGFGFGTFIDMWGHWLYPTIAFQIFGNFLGLGYTYIGIVIILNRLFDAVSDPFFGWLSDRTRTRIGRRRPYMFVGAALAGLGLPFLLAVTTGWGDWHVLGITIPKYFVFMIASSAIYLPIVSCFNLPYQSLGNEMTPDYHERTSLFSFKNIIQKLPEFGLFFFGFFFTRGVWIDATPDNALVCLKRLFLLDGAAWANTPDGVRPNMLLGAQTYLVICGVIVIVAGTLCALTVRERYYGKLVAAGKQERVSVVAMLAKTFQCRPFRIQLLMQIAYQMGTSMVNALGLAVTIYYVSAGNESEGNFYNTLMGATYALVGFLGIPAFAMVSRYLGKRHALMCVFGLGILVFISTWWLYTPSVKGLQVLASGLISFCNAGFWMLSASVGADVIDCDELQTGQRREGAFAACGAWAMKMGMAIGAGVSFFILDWVGLDKMLGGAQSGSTIFLMRFLLAAVPIAGLAIGLIALAKFPLTQAKTLEIRAQLEARRGKV